MRFFAAALVAVVVAGCSPVPNPTPAPPANPSPSNTGVIVPEVTADSAGTPASALPADKRITDEIRQKIHADIKLSANARSVQIVTAGGKVSLRGTVDSSEEKDTVEKLAAEVVGKDNVTSDIVWKE